MINLIVATSKNNVIGLENKLPWHLPKDLKRFKELTIGKPVVMGRKTHLSIGKVLPNRLNIILSKDLTWNKPLGDGCIICRSVEEVIEKFKFSDLFIIGGEQIYSQFLPYTDKIYLTVVDVEVSGDAYFPTLSEEWKEIKSEIIVDNGIGVNFIELTKS